MTRPFPGPRTVWAAAVLAYAVAVLQRSSMGVAGLEATERFQASATIVSSFVVLQLLVYALAQVPAGVLLDRVGPRVTLTAGAVLMGLGQLALAHTDVITAAVLARIVVGCGDALTFSSAIRLVPAWFPAARVPLVTQVTGIVGQVGQVASAVPFVALLAGPGWTTAFGAAAATCAVSALAALLLVRAAPPGAARGRRGGGRSTAGRDLRRTLLVIGRIVRHPSVHLGFLTHFTSALPGVVFTMMWGYPYLTAGEGLSRATASAVMTVIVVVSIVGGPAIGALTQRHPLRRSSLVLVIVAAMLVLLTTVVLWPGPAPLWLLLALAAAISIGGPGSTVGFDFPRTTLARHRLGTATGIVIMGGFLGGLVAILLMGLVLDLRRPDGDYDLGAFRTALAVQIPLLLLGAAGMVAARRRVRRREGLSVPPWRDVWRSGRWRSL